MKLIEIQKIILSIDPQDTLGLHTNHQIIEDCDIDSDDHKAILNIEQHGCSGQLTIHDKNTLIIFLTILKMLNDTNANCNNSCDLTSFKIVNDLAIKFKIKNITQENLSQMIIATSILENISKNQTNKN